MKHRKLAYLLFFILFVFCTIAIALNPNKFQKLNSFRLAEKYNNHLSLNIPNTNFDVIGFISKIPYNNNYGYIYTVHPETKYNNTIVKGGGDCSTLSFGAAYYFLKHDIDFELIHFLPEKNLFGGGGHVAIRMPFYYDNKNVIGIVDLAGGGFIADGWNDFNVNGFAKINKTFKLNKINNLASDFFKNYYDKTYLSNIHFGYTPKGEIEHYFKFLNKYYIAFNNEKYEKYIYDGLAIILGQYYNIYVGNQIHSMLKHEIFLFSAILLYIRIFVISLPFIAITEIILYKKINRSASLIEKIA